MAKKEKKPEPKKAKKLDYITANKLRGDGQSDKDIAEKFGLSKGEVKMIRKRDPVVKKA